jgi:hypothetical protein
MIDSDSENEIGDYIDGSSGECSEGSSSIPKKSSKKRRESTSDSESDIAKYVGTSSDESCEGRYKKNGQR